MDSSRSHLAAGFGAFSARFGACLALVRVKLAAFLCACRAQIGADRADTTDVVGFPSQHLRAGRAIRDAVEAQPQTSLHIGLPHMGGEADVSRRNAFVAGVYADLDALIE